MMPPLSDMWSSIPHETVPIPSGQSLVDVQQSQIQSANDQDPPSIIAEPSNAVVEDLLEEMSSRGKGSYFCPYGASCLKGGVSTDGSLTVFERNSAFKAHLEKHLKTYKCNLPGCPNKSGFSRPDLLYRHQRIVPHEIPIDPSTD
ncbi:hypothetical protein GGR51DRAFT_558586 [Nemania sp. FL0031]|nr:hypothetical protein GGR51DRAFT_558586 [Nemania sp. FL0031]